MKSATERLLESLRAYNGRPIKIMEVCGTHTATAAHAGLYALLPPSIRLISGPGCPVCLAADAYIGRLCELADQGCIIVSFGDLLRVPGPKGTLLDAKARGARVEMVYNPMDALEIARKNPDCTVVMAAVGFETTAPAFALLAREAISQGLTNLRLLTALKRLMPALEALCAGDGPDAFIAPGHVAVILGSDAFIPLAQRFRKPFAVAGFTGEQMLAAIALLVRRIETPYVGNLYGQAVRPEGNPRARSVLEACFTPGETSWRGLGVLADSGLYLKDEFTALDAGSTGLYDAPGREGLCRCGQVLTGIIEPADCPQFGHFCTPQSPMGPCMVSAEGACGIRYLQGGFR